ncbi:MAG: hypothetical protein SF069_11680 [Phycisphaerae bacterium]|nr:hypothetical protein [Phycisphaerae bacterium]
MRTYSRPIMLLTLSLLVSGSIAVAAPIYPGNILVIGQTEIGEYTAAGVLVQSITVPWPGGGTRPINERLRDSVALPDGRIAVFNGTFSPWLSVYDSHSGGWDHRTFAGWSTANSARAGGITAIGQRVIASDERTSGAGVPSGMVRFDLDSGATSRFETERGRQDVNIGLDGKLYALGTGTDPITEVYVFDPISLTRERTILLNFPVSASGIAANAGGELYITENGTSSIHHFAKDGEPIRTILTPGTSPNDIDIAPDGRVIFSTQTSGAFITDESFESIRLLTNVPLEEYVSFASYVPEPSSLALLTSLALAWRRAHRMSHR